MVFAVSKYCSLEVKQLAVFIGLGLYTVDSKALTDTGTAFIALDFLFLFTHQLTYMGVNLCGLVNGFLTVLIAAFIL